MAFWSVDRRDRIAVCTFTRPPRNFMSFASMTEFEGVVEERASQTYASGGSPGL